MISFCFVGGICYRAGIGTNSPRVKGRPICQPFRVFSSTHTHSHTYIFLAFVLDTPLDLTPPRPCFF